MTHKTLWHVVFETTAVGSRYVAADWPQEAIETVTEKERDLARKPHLHVHINRVERLGTVMIP